MVTKLDEKKTLLGGLSITLGMTVLGGYMLTTFTMPEFGDVTC